MVTRPVGVRQARLAFSKVWRLRGEPTLLVIHPVSEWSLPAGVAYSRHVDQFVNGAGAPVVIDWRTQPNTVLGFLPKSNSQDSMLRALGVVTTDTSTVVVQWSAEAQARIEGAWGVSIGGKLYRIKSWRLDPAGTEHPLTIELSLTEGD